MLSHLRLNSKRLIFEWRIAVIWVARQRRHLPVLLVEFVSVLNAHLKLDNCNAHTAHTRYTSIRCIMIIKSEWTTIETVILTVGERINVEIINNSEYSLHALQNHLLHVYARNISIFALLRLVGFLSASLYFSKRGAYWDRLCRDVVGRWSLVGCHARALWPNGAS